MLPAKELARSTQLQQDGDLAAGRGGGGGEEGRHSVLQRNLTVRPQAENPASDTCWPRSVPLRQFAC